jgi:hypothetical protein
VSAGRILGFVDMATFKQEQVSGHLFLFVMIHIRLVLISYLLFWACATACRWRYSGDPMNNIMQDLFALQTLQLQSGSKQRNREGAMEAIRKTIPSAILMHYERLLARGKNGVAIVRNGVCTGCHISVAIGPLAGLAQKGDIRACGNCGRYLFLPANEPIVPVVLPLPVKTPRRKKNSLAHAG